MTREFWVETNAEAQIVRWSDEAPAALGYSSRALFGRSVSRLIVVDRPTDQTIWSVMRGSPVETSGATETERAPCGADHIPNRAHGGSVRGGDTSLDVYSY